MVSDEKIRKSVLAIFRNIDIINNLFEKSQREEREYLIVIADQVRFFAGERGEVSIDYVKDFDPDSVRAVLHTHPRGPSVPSIQDLLATNYALVKYSIFALHGVITRGTLALYNYYSINEDMLTQVLAKSSVSTLTDEDKLRISGAVFMSTNPLDITRIPEIIDYFVGWYAYWKVQTFDTFEFNFDELRVYNALKRNALFLDKGKQTIEWYDGKRQAEVYWWIPEVNTKRNTAFWYKVYEFVYENTPFKVVLQSYGDVDISELGGIKPQELVAMCETRRFCRVIS